MSQTIRQTTPNDDRNRVTVTLDPDGGYRIEEKAAEETAPLPPSYADYLRVVRGGGGTVCVPSALSASIPEPCLTTASSVAPAQVAGPMGAATNLRISESGYTECFGLEQGLNCELIPQEEIQSLWNEVLAESNRQVTRQSADQAKMTEERKAKKLEMLLRLALNSGNIEMAMLLFSGLEAKQANEVTAGLLNRMQQLQDERKKASSQMANTGDQTQDLKNSQAVQTKMNDISTEMNLLQTLMQDIQSRKNETQQMASNYLKSRHDTGMGIIRNMG